MALNPNDVSRPHVWRPAAEPEKARTLLLLHGSGADEHDLLPLGKLLDPAANLLSPRGLVRVDGANRFFLRNDDGTFVEDDIVKNSAELAEFLWAASGEYGFDANNVYAVGFSNGANAAGALLLLQPDSVKGIVAWHNQVVRAHSFQEGSRPNRQASLDRKWGAGSLFTS